MQDFKGISWIVFSISVPVFFLIITSVIALLFPKLANEYQIPVAGLSIIFASAGANYLAKIVKHKESQDTVPEEQYGKLMIPIFIKVASAGVIAILFLFIGIYIYLQLNPN